MSNEHNSTSVDMDNNEPPLLMENESPIVVGSSESPGNVEDMTVVGQSQTQNPALDETSKRRLTSDVWNHFKRQKIDGKLKAICNYCKKKLMGDPRQGTSHLRLHWKSCPLRATRDIR
ncbi:hypothetical protein Cni_G17730 [Canna indica]|uniref:BED-type domain-containing protein n=1 Tax=Canna indica TaxID=4628 RepID=A0AAQ3KJE7_9LILI|nr:hypothetical protein Cni_G17730 [Canna indica]